MDSILEKSHVIKIILKKNNIEYNLALVFSKIELYYGINNIATSGNIVITEQGNLISELPIDGTETIDVTFQTFRNPTSKNGISDTYTHTYFVYSVDAVSENADVRTYVIKFTDAIGLINNDIRISARYNNYSEEIIKNIFDKILSQKKAIYKSTFDILKFKNELTSSTAYEKNFVVPNWKPLQLFSYLTNIAVSDSNAKYNDCLFFQRTNGTFVFTSYNHILKNMEHVKLSKFPANLDPETDTNLRSEAYNIVSYSFTDIFNTQIQKLSGMLGYTSFILDFATKQYMPVLVNEQTIFDIVNNQRKDLNSIIPYNAVEKTNNSLHSILLFNIGLDELDNDYKTHIEPVYVHGNPVNNYANYFKINIELDGASNLDIGTPVTLEIENNPNISEAFAKYLNSSIWIITKLKHDISLNSAKTFIEICSPSIVKE